MNFYGRTVETARLNKMLSSEDQSVALIYGRRRVGKSELIKYVFANVGSNANPNAAANSRSATIANASRDASRNANRNASRNGSPGAKPRTIYYECKQTSERNNVDSLSALISESFSLPPLAFSDIEATLKFLFRASTDEPILLALDEYPYLRETVSGLDSILKSLIDEYQHRSKLKLFLCGSFIDTMKSLLEVQNPLYGRVDLTMLVEPMDYYDSALFYPGFSNEDKVRLYSVFGGMPYYNRLIQPGLTVEENLAELIVSEGARLENEVSMNLKSELHKLINANEVFDALARGYSKFQDLLSQSHVSSSPTLSDTLEKLMKMMLVVKRAPINDPNNRKKAGYFISDNLSLFYYKYIYRYSSQRAVMNTRDFYDRYIKEDFEHHHVPKVFEEIAKQYLIRLNRSPENRSAVEPFDLIGTYYYDVPSEKRSGEFDVVTKGLSGYVFYEVKYRNAKISTDMIRAEIAQIKQSGIDCRKFGFVSKSGFEDDVLLLASQESLSQKSAQKKTSPKNSLRKEMVQKESTAKKTAQENTAQENTAQEKTEPQKTAAETMASEGFAPEELILITLDDMY